MHIQPGRAFGFLVVAAMALQWAFPALAAPSAVHPAPSVGLLPAWYASAGQASAQSTSLALSKSASPDPVDQGDLLVYVITLTNQTAEEAQRTVVTDTTPAGTVFESASVLQSGGATWFWGGLSAGESGDFIWFTSDRIGFGTGLPGNRTAVLQFVVRVVGPFPDQGLIHNDACYADAANAERVQGSDVTTVVNAPAFTLSKVASSDPITAGERLTYTIRLTNTGHLAASLPYTIVEVLPDHTVYAASSPPAQVAGGVLTWTLSAPLGIGQAATTAFAVTVTAPLTDGLSLLNDEYWAFSSEVTPTAAGPALATSVRSWPMLSIHKADQPDPTIAGGTIGYTLIVTNDVAANGPAQGLVVTDRVPLSTTLLAAPGATWSGTGPGSQITWTRSSFLWPGQSAAFAFTVTVDSPLVSGTLILNDDYGATATNALAPVMGDPVTTTVQSYPDLRLVKTAEPTLLAPDDPVTFTLAFSNVGTTSATGVVVTDTLPVSLTAVTWVGTPNVSLAAAAHPHYTWTVTPLAPDQGGMITLTARVMTTTAWGQSTPLVNRARISTVDTDIQPANNADQATVTVVPGPAAQVVLASAPPTLSLDCSAAVTATVLDAWGNPVADGTVVTFTTSTATSGVSPVSDTTLAGQAHTTLTSTRPGPVVVTGTVGSGAFSTTTVGFTPGAPATFLFDVIADQVAGIPFTVVFTATDSHGNVATGFEDWVNLSDGTGTLVPAVAGPATAGVLSQMVTITQAWVADRITATAWVTPACGAPRWAVGVSPAFTVTHGAPVSLSLSPPQATVPAGTQLVYTAVATDGFGNTWNATHEVTYTASGGNTFLGTPPGNHILSATVVGVNLPLTGTLDGVQAMAYVTVTHGTAAQLSISPPTTTVVAGSWVTYTAVATDAFGNSWDATVETAFAAGGGNSFVGSVLSATVAGTWPVTGTLGNAWDTAVITVTPGPAHHLAFSPIGSQVAGTGFTVVITAEDSFGNRVSGFAGTISLTDTTGTLSPTSWGSWTDGVASFTALVTQAWSGDVITATAVATPSLWGASAPFDVVGGAPANLTYQTPATMPICSRAPVTVTVTDSWGNPVADGTVVTMTASIGLSFVESGGSYYYPTTAGGRAVATLEAGLLSGLASTSARAGSVGPVWRTVDVVTPGLPATLDLVAAPLAIYPLTGTAFLTATVEDCAGNPLAGVVVDFTASLGNVQPPSATTTLDGQATAVFSSAVEGVAVVTASVDSLSDQVAISVLPSMHHTYLPLVMRDYRGINLVVEGIVVEPPSPAPGQPVVVSVTIRNLGVTAVGSPFWVDLYLDPTALPTPGVRWDQICSEGVAWQVPGLGAGQSLTLRSDQGAPNYTYWIGSFADQPDPHQLYAVVDVWPGPPGAVVEDREDDNVLGPVNVSMGP